MAMSLEQTDHFLRHVKMHADEVKLETFKKDNAHNAMYSIPIFNFNNMEQLQAIVKA